MNTNPKAKTILCYGDSNTWGQMPDRSGRYDAATRWTGQLQNLLGSDYYVIEEGLGGRTTNLDDPDSVKNGLTYLVPCIKSHEPLDYVVIMLGTNDFKTRFHRTPSDIAEAIGELVTVTQRYTSARILLTSPIYINPTAPRFSEFYNNDFPDTAGSESQKLAALLSIIAKSLNCEFLNAANFAKTGKDGLHIDQPSLALLASEIAKKLL